MATEPATSTTEIAPTNSQGDGKRMWPSPIVAGRVYDVANIALVVSASIAAVATFLVIWMGNVKEKYSRAELAELALQTAQANERAAKANEAAERERVERLKLEARLADRVVSSETMADLQRVAASFAKGTRLDICTFATNVEIANFSESVSSALTRGGWTVRQWEAMGGSLRGVLVGVDPTKPTTLSAARFLVEALSKGGFVAQEVPFTALPDVNRTGPGEPMDAPIRMYIGSK